MIANPEPGRPGLRRRVAGAQLPGAAPENPTPPAERQPRHDPAATKSAMDGFQTAFAQGASAPLAPIAQPPVAQPPVAQPAPLARPVAQPAPAEAPLAGGRGGHGGLTRRVPGESLAPGLRRQASALRKKPPGTLPPRAPRGWHERDPEAERSAFDAFSSGLARADNDPTKESQG